MTDARKGSLLPQPAVLSPHAPAFDAGRRLDAGSSWSRSESRVVRRVFVLVATVDQGASRISVGQPADDCQQDRLSKSSVQLALRRLERRQLIDASTATIANPARRVLKPWASKR